MDIKQAEMQFLGFFGVLQEAFKLISSRKKLFTQISLAFLLFPSLIFMTHTTLSDILHDSILRDKRRQRYMNLSRLVSDQLDINIIIKETILKLNFAVSHFALLVSYTLATSVVACSVACIYAGGETTFKKVVRVIPRTYKRLANTSLYAYLFVFFTFQINSTLDEDSLYTFHRYIFSLPFYGYLRSFYFLLGHVLNDLSLLGLGYMIISSQMAMVVSVLEKTTGVDAINKGMKLVQGRKWTKLIRLVMFLVPTRIIYAVLGEQDSDKVYYGGVLVVLFSVLVVFEMVVQTVEYYVFKSENGESVDVLTLVDDLEVYNDEPEGEKSPHKVADEEVKQVEAVENV